MSEDPNVPSGYVDWYLIPCDRETEFETKCAEAYEADDFYAFEVAFGNFRINGPHDLTFTAPLDPGGNETMTKLPEPFASRMSTVANDHCENMRPGSSVPYTDEFKDAWEIRVSFEAGAEALYTMLAPEIEAELAKERNYSAETHARFEEQNERITQLQAENAFLKDILEIKQKYTAGMEDE